MKIHNLGLRRRLLLGAQIAVVVALGTVTLLVEVDTGFSWMVLLLVYVALTCLYVPMFFHKRYIGYNKHGMYIRMARDRGHMLRFELVRNMSLQNGLLTIELRDGSQHVIDLDDADPRDCMEMELFLQQRHQLI